MAFPAPPPPSSGSKSKKKRPRPQPQDPQHHTEEDFTTPTKKPNSGGGTWASLDLILSLQNKALDLQRKIDLAFNFTETTPSVAPSPVSLPRVTAFLADWIQPLLISPDHSKRGSNSASASASASSDSSLDFRCWAVLRFSLEHSFVACGGGVSPNLLKAVTRVLQHGHQSENLLQHVMECLSLLLSSNARAFSNAGVELWVPCAVEAVCLASGILLKNENDSPGVGVSNSLSVLLLQHFAGYLRFHPNPKNIFKVFVDRLLEPLMELLVLLQLRAVGGECAREGSLLGMVEDVLSNGLFHPVHVSGFFSSRSLGAKQERESRGINESYHRHFFKRLENIVSEKKVTALGSLGHLLRLFAGRAKERRGTSLSSKSDRTLQNSDGVSEEAEGTTRTLFEVFVRFMEPLLTECRRCGEKDFVELGEDTELRLVESHCTLKSMNETLSSFIQEKIYMRMEDTSEGAHFNFLKEVFEAIISISEKMCMFWLSAMTMDSDGVKRMLALIAREVVVAVGYLVEIEYKVIEDNLVKLWVIMLSYLAAYLSSEERKPISLLTTDILNLSCKLINVYSELRQVNNPIFSLCKAVRFLRTVGDNSGVAFRVLVTSKPLSCAIYLKSVATLLCSQEFRLSISKAIKSIPEGQASGCIQQLNVDIKDSLDWMRENLLKADGKKLAETNIPGIDILNLDLQAELLGKCLCELYTLVLDSTTITATKAVLVGNSINSLMQTIRPTISYLLQNQPDSLDKFFLSLIGEKSSHEIPGSRSSLWTNLQGLPWIFVFFFRMYVSCRSLYRQAISLMPPRPSKEASLAMGNLLTVSCGPNWAERPEAMDEGYFSWIVKPSDSLPNIIAFLSKDILMRKYSGYSSLVYVFHVMTLQRLSDLSRKLKALEFLNERDAHLVQIPFPETAGVQKSESNWEELIAASKHEAAELTDFMTGYLPLLVSEKQYISSQLDRVDKTKMILPADKGAWDLGIYSLNENSLPTALWWLLCQNTDIWCAHATSKNLKKFLSYLFHYLVPYEVTSSGIGEQTSEICQKVTVPSISSTFLSDTSLYDQPILYKHFASRFCSMLKNSLSSLMSHALVIKEDLNSLPSWSEILKTYEKRTSVDKDERNDAHELLRSALEFIPSNIHFQERSEKQSSSFSIELKTCQGLLNFLSKMLNVLVNDESFLHCATYVINLERLMISSLFSYYNGSFVCNPYDLFSVFNSCRRVLKNLVTISVEGNPGARPSFLFSDVFNCPSSISWLLISVSEISVFSHAFFGENTKEVKEMIFSLIDQTSCIFYMLSKSTHSLLIYYKDNPSGEADQFFNSSGHFDAFKYVELVAETLKEQTSNAMDSMNSSVHTIKLESYRLSSALSCTQGFLWGLAASLDNFFLDCSSENSCLSVFPSISKLWNCISVFVDIVNLCMNTVINDNHETKVLHVVHNLPDLGSEDGLSSMDVFRSIDFPVCAVEPSSENRSGLLRECERSRSSPTCQDDKGNNSPRGGHTEISEYKKQRPSTSHANIIGSILNEFRKVDLSKQQNVRGPLLRGLLKGENSHTALALRELFLACAAILKLNCMSSSSRKLGLKIDRKLLASSSMGILLGVSHVALLEMAEMIGRLDPFSFVWLDGILKFLEVIGSNIKLTDPNLSRDVYALLIDTHLRSIGKCISLQGKSARLSSHEIGSNTKLLPHQNGSSNNDMLFHAYGERVMSTFKARLRMSFKEFISRPRKLHILTVMEALKRALIGLKQNYTGVYEIHTGSVNGGSMSSVVAAGIECFDLVLESVSGQKHDIEKYISSLIGAVFNIILHLQSPMIFYTGKFVYDKSELNPDAGSTILMCVEVLTKIAGRKVTRKDSFVMDPSHVSQCLHIPMALFQNFHKVGVYRSAYGNMETKSKENMHHYVIDHQFSVDLYASCCRLLCTTLKHKKRKVKQCIAILEDSVTTLLCCLETVNAELLKQKSYFTWEMQEAVKCASFLRRIYEEIRHQKDAFATYSSNFLSTYITISSGSGPLKSGIKRDIDEALRPGVYSLIDICTPTDLQKLHTILGEDPCRSTLKTVLDDYELNFQYEGKV